MIALVNRALEVCKKYKDYKGKSIDLAVDAIIYDLSDRRGIKNEWYNIDKDIQEQIKIVWKEIIKASLGV